MFVPWVPTREGNAALRDYIAGGGREVELELGPDIAPGTVLTHTFAHSSYRVEVHGSALVAARGQKRGGRLFVRDDVPALTLKAAVDWEARLARGVFDMGRMLTRKHVAVIAQNDLWQLALVIGGHAGTPAS